MPLPTQQTIQKKPSALQSALPSLLVVISVALIFMIVKPQYETYVALWAEKVQIETDISSALDKERELKRLEELSKSTEMQFKIERYAKSFREDDVYEDIFSLARRAGLTIDAISMSPGSQLPNGFHEGTVNFSVQFDSTAKLMQFIRQISSQNDPSRGKNAAQRAFMLKGMSYPYGENISGPISFPIDLTIYYLDV